MFKYALRRLLLFIPMLLGITLVTFIFIHLAPGNFLDTLKLNPQVSPETIAVYEQKFHLDQPWYVQYFFWLKNILTGNFGYSFAYKAPVAEILYSRAGNTLLLSAAALILTWLMALPAGIFCARYSKHFFGRLVSLITQAGVAVPSFLWAFILLYLAALTGWFPLGGMHASSLEEMSAGMRLWDLMRHIAIPSLVIALPGACALTRLLRANMLEQMNNPYVTAAHARGIPHDRIIYHHVLKNALNPMITIFGYQFSDLLSGAALVEIICAWPGLGMVTLDAVRSQDVYLVMGTVLIGALLLMAGNLLADILLAANDPRIRYQKAG